MSAAVGTDSKPLPHQLRVRTPRRRRLAVEECRRLEAVAVLRRFVTPTAGVNTYVVRVTRRNGKPGLRLQLRRTTTPIGGHRWWIVCPACRGQFAHLYLPPGSSALACRLCWTLAYRSQHARKTDL